MDGAAFSNGRSAFTYLWISRTMASSSSALVVLSTRAALKSAAPFEKAARKRLTRSPLLAALPTSGRVLQIGDPPAHSLNPLTYIFQDFALLPWRTVEGNISLALEDHRIGRAKAKEIIDDVLRRTNLTEFRRAFPRQLSGGMKQRVAIARALSVSPAVFLMDEPLSALDSQTREILMDDLIELWTREQFTACYVTHNLAEAVRLGHKIVVLSRRPGRIREVVEIDIPLAERAGRSLELEDHQKHLWGLLREEARAADQELVNV